MRYPGNGKCTGPVTPSTGPVHLSHRFAPDSPFRKRRRRGTMRKVSEADSGKGQMLRFKARSADKGSMVSVVHENASREVRRRDRESGQALVEFALILPLFLVIVVGIIQFGVGAQLLARHAADRQPGSALRRGELRSAAGNQCGPSTLENYLGSRTGLPRRTGHLQRQHPFVEICYVPPTQPPPGGWTPSAGDAVRVRTERAVPPSGHRETGEGRSDGKGDDAARAEANISRAADRTDTANWVLTSHTGSARCKA